MNCNQNFKTTSFNVRQLKKINKYLILFIANLKIDSFNKKYQIFMLG